MDGKISEQRVYCKIRAQLGLGFHQQKFMLICKKFMGMVLYNMLQFASGYVILMMVRNQLKMTLGWVGQFPF